MSFIKQVMGSLSGRIILLSGVFALIAVSAILWLNATKTRTIYENLAVDHLRHETQAVSIRLEEDFRVMARDASIISDAPTTQRLVSAMSDEDLADELAQVRLMFESVLGRRDDYLSLSLISAETDAREIIRVDRDRNTYTMVARDGLRAFGDSELVYEGRRLRIDETWFSSLSLNTERSGMRPVFQAVHPVYDRRGRLFGFIAISSDFEILMQRVMQRIAPDYDTIVYDGRQNAFVYSAARERGEFVIGDTEMDELTRSVAGRLRTAPDQAIRVEGHVVFHTPIKALDDVSGLNFSVAHAASTDVLFADFDGTVSDSSALVVMIILTGVGIVALIANHLTAPLREMSSQISRYSRSKGARALELPTGLRGEIGDLAREFSDLVGNLEDSKRKTESIINQIEDGLILADSRGIIQSFNPAAEAMFGYSAAEVIGQNITHLMTDRYKKPHDGYLKNFKSGTPTTVLGEERELTARRKNGEEFSVEISVSEVLQNGKRYFCGVLKDISVSKATRRQIEYQRQTLEFSLDAGKLGFWDLDMTTDTMIVSDAYAAMIGYTKAEIDGHSSWFIKAIHPDEKKDMARRLDNFVRLQDGDFDIEFRLKHRQGHWVWIHSRAKVVERNKRGLTRRIVGVNADITERKLNELETLEKNRQLEIAESVANMGHWSLDLETLEMEWSDNMFVVHGMVGWEKAPSVEEMVGYYHPEERDEVGATVMHAVQNCEPFEFINRYVCPDGTVKHLHGRADVINDGISNRQIMFGIIKDVTAQVEANEKIQENQEKNRLLLENIIDGVVTIAEDGQIDGANPACESIFGYDPGELTGQHSTLLLADSVSKAELYDLRRFFTNSLDDTRAQTIELQGKRKSGEEFSFEVALSAMEVSGQKLITGIIRDITARKQMESMKDEFVSTVNHELRTPLTSIYGSLDLLLTMFGDELSEDAEELVTLAHDGCGRLSSLVNDILDIEKIAAGKMTYQMEVMDLEDLVSDVVRRHQPLSVKYNVEFNVRHRDGGTRVKLDPARFNQALVNLISNACKFSPDGESVVISTTNAPRENFVRVSVRDRGPGIPENFRARIFEKFSQADGSSTKAANGTGLGLNITKSIIEAFDGQVSFETELGAGTIFYFDLPIYEEALVLEQKAS